MSRWFRLYDSVLDDPKVQRLSPSLFKFWINCLCAASRNGGKLPEASDLAFMLRCDMGKLKEGIHELDESGLIDRDETGIITPHNWNGRQFRSDDVTARVKRFRNARRNVSKNVSETPIETPPDTDTDTDTDTERERRARSALSNASFERFWSVWPHKVGKPAALRSFVKASDEIGAILAGVERYVRDKPPDRPWLNPATFLNQRRWEDAPAAIQIGKINGQPRKGSLIEAGIERIKQLSEMRSTNGNDVGNDVVRLLQDSGDERAKNLYGGSRSGA